MNRKLLLAFWVPAVVFCGCVPPEKMDPSVLLCYQQAMEKCGTPPRCAEAGLGLLTPTTATKPPLEVGHNEATGRKTVRLSLDDAVLRTLANSLDVRVVSFTPAISREDIVRAESEFDVAVFANTGYQTDNVQDGADLGGQKSNTRTVEAGLRQKTITGATWEASWQGSRNWTDRETAVGIQPEYETILGIKATQPLLRNAWTEVNLANVRIARLSYRSSLADFRRQVEETVTGVIANYWNLVQARNDVVILRELLARTVETLERVKGRATLDATDVEIKQAEAAVEARRAALIRAEKVVWDVQDTLARQLMDKDINLLGEYEIIPTTDPATTEIRYDLADQLLLALRCNPVLEQARLAIATADIKVRVARQQTLPRLDLTLTGGLQGLNDTPHGAYEGVNGGEYASYGAFLEFEYPLGNRQRQAELRQSQYARLQAVAQMQNTADQVAVAVRERIRQIDTAYQEILAQRASVAASRTQLKALETTEEIRGRLSPEFLQVKLSAQESLALAQQNELRAIVSYNSAMADLSRATGSVLELRQVRLALPRFVDDCCPLPPVPADSGAPVTPASTRPTGAQPVMTMPVEAP